jgi:hypothetical protein
LFLYFRKQMKALSAANARDSEGDFGEKRPL